MAHPGSPSAVWRPRLSLRGEVWTALLGSNRRNGITGFGRTVEAGPSDFDTRYLRALRPPEVSNKAKETKPRATLWPRGRQHCGAFLTDPFHADFLRE
jgi:hypothetical protein